ncbi:hypothetical protein I5907_21285 [Panacibacter sp. DH6]|uniref:Uncharacterized protein n=1 Tax=Panacibacter microcysteis TaxID=2793269 RepID=A0A931H0I8_9BACT|nr:hypothetical protein [Panacibacter microcysteis]MBG9378780.1 hypothetical protein [Panacibacter microcysteis]
MDRNELEVALQPFRDECANKGYPLLDICVFEAYPGDNSTSYIVQVKVDWVDHMDCSEAIDILFDILWEKCDEEIRKKVFSIVVMDTNDQLHCFYENLQEAQKPDRFTA